jgi:hypothetical protein
MDRFEQGLVDLGYADKRTTVVKHLLTFWKVLPLARAGG